MGNYPVAAAVSVWAWARRYTQSSNPMHPAQQYHTWQRVSTVHTTYVQSAIPSCIQPPRDPLRTQRARNHSDGVLIVSHNFFLQYICIYNPVPQRSWTIKLCLCSEGIEAVSTWFLVFLFFPFGIFFLFYPLDEVAFVDRRARSSYKVVEV